MYFRPKMSSAILVERKTIDDFVASVANGRLFRQIARLERAVPRPLLILEGDPETLTTRMSVGLVRGIQLAVTVGFRIPILATLGVGQTAAC